MSIVHLADLMQFIAIVASLLVAGMLLLFNLRRLSFTLAAVVGSRRAASSFHMPARALPDVLVLASCRNEGTVISDLCDALARLDYPRDAYQVVLIDDGSHDRTGKIMAQAAYGKSGWHVLSLAKSLGKARALNAALRKMDFGEIVYVFDADHRPRPDVLRRAVRHFESEKVAGVSGRTLPVNPIASPGAFYSTVESYVHQMVTMRAKDRLELAPALLGSNCGYRRSALVECGGFREDALLEDSDMTLAFYLAGYRVRFAEDAVAFCQVPETVGGYLKQHARWTRGFHDVAHDHARTLLNDRRLSLWLRLELLLFSAGYLDRMAFMGAVMLTCFAFLSGGAWQFLASLVILALLVPMLQILALFVEQRVPVAMWVRLPLIPLFYCLDLLAALRGFGDALFRKEKVWNSPPRVSSRSPGS